MRDDREMRLRLLDSYLLGFVGDIVFDEKSDLKDASYDINHWSDGKYAPIAK